MSLLYSLVFASRCRSNHHRLAVDALRHLQSPDAEAWRMLLLHHHDDYLKGAKAPDEVFKDFKNHVLHVRENNWGGAIEACEEWQRRTVRALKEHDWKQAAWCAGVMSHYYVDPIQPFHTHQTEEEGVIHRAVEWSFSKSYATFQRILEQDLGGYPDVQVPKGDKWLAQMVIAGAKASNPHYETIIAHYDHAVGVKKPEAGLDQELKDVIAGLVGHAAVGLARILDQTFDEAGVKPPRVNGALDVVFVTMTAPIKAVLAAIENEADRKLVAAQYEEFRRTGKVRETLGEDDKVVRELHAVEVLKTPLSSLDARWPREVGTEAGSGAPPRQVKKKKAKAAPKPKAARTPKPAKPKPTPQAPVELAAPAPEKPKPEKRPPAPAPSEARVFTLHPGSPVVDAPAIGPKTAKRLEAIGVKTVGDLLALSPATGAVILDQRHITSSLIVDWQAQARLACTVPGLRSREAQALVACGIRSAEDLIASEPALVAEAVGRWAESDEAARVWGEAPAPTEEDVAGWIARAKGPQRPNDGRKRSAA